MLFEGPKGKYLLIILLVLAGAVGLSITNDYVIGKSQNKWICKDGSWVKQGNPPDPQPNEECVSEYSLSPIINDKYQKGIITVYYPKTVEEDSLPTQDCNTVFEVERADQPSDHNVESVLRLLFAGPTEKELAEGYHSFFSDSGNIITKAIIKDGVAFVNFRDIRSEFGAKGANTSCGSAAFHASILNTLQSNFGVEQVIYAIDGDAAAYYEWMQIECPDETYCGREAFE